MILALHVSYVQMHYLVVVDVLMHQLVYSVSQVTLLTAQTIAHSVRDLCQDAHIVQVLPLVNLAIQDIF